jgi:hypothetical protein
MNKILNKIAQMERNAEEVKSVELASHEVSLSAFDDFKNAVSNVMDMKGRAYNDVKSARPILEQALKQYKMIEPSILRSMKYGIDLEDQVKKLGLELPADYKATKERLFDEEAKVKDGISRVEKLLSGLNF